MESVKDKRVVNGAAWFFLGLSMFATLIGVITNFVTYSTHMKMGIYLNSSLYIVEAILDILILVAGFFTFKKNRYALIALAALFIIRMFATIPWGGDVSRAYMLGVHSYDIDPHSYDVDPLEEGRAFKEQSLFACKQAAA